MAAAPRARIDVLGVMVDAITMADALAVIAAWIDARDQHYVCVTGVHGIMESRRDAGLRGIHNAAGLVTPDGMPLVWLGRANGSPQMERVYGPDLILTLCEQSLGTGYRHYFYGGAPGVPERLVGRLRQRYPTLAVAGAYSPPFRVLGADEDAAIVDAINAAEPDIVWVGMSTPKQERWMHAHVGRVRAPVMIGVGAAFDFHAGLKRQAPRWMQRSGLEWSFRLAMEPRRLWRRYLVNNPWFVWEITRQSMNRRRSAATRGARASAVRR